MLSLAAISISISSLVLTLDNEADETDSPSREKINQLAALEHVKRTETGISGISNLFLDNKKTTNVAIVCGLVANDFNGVAACHDLISKNELSSHVNYNFFPISNPSGFDYATLTDPSWKRNRRVVDRRTGARLDRNFDFEFKKMSCDDDQYGGTGPSSEPEIVDLVAELKAKPYDAVIYIDGTSQAKLITPFYKNSNHFRRMDQRLRKSFAHAHGDENAVRPVQAEQYGKITEWALAQGIEYTAEVSGDYPTHLSFLNSLATIINNRVELDPNPIDAFVWREDDNFAFEKVNTQIQGYQHIT